MFICNWTCKQDCIRCHRGTHIIPTLVRGNKVGVIHWGCRPGPLMRDFITPCICGQPAWAAPCSACFSSFATCISPMVSNYVLPLLMQSSTLVLVILTALWSRGWYPTTPPTPLTPPPLPPPTSGWRWTLGSWPRPAGLGLAKHLQSGTLGSFCGYEMVCCCWEEVPCRWLWFKALPHGWW